LLIASRKHYLCYFGEETLDRWNAAASAAENSVHESWVKQSVFTSVAIRRNLGKLDA
jgi:hypothetical protein